MNKHTLIFLMLVLTRFPVVGQWVSIHSGTPFDLRQIAFADSLNGYIIGDSSFQTILLKTSDGGYTWNQILNNNQVFGIDFLNRDTGAVLGNDTVFKTFDSGNNWTVTAVTDPFSFQGSSLFHMNTATEWFYIRGQRHAHTSDAGTTWTEISMGNSGPIPIVPTDMQFVNNATIIGIGWYGPNTFISTDKGNNWKFWGALDASYVSSCTFPVQSTGYATADGRILKSMDGGVTWNPIDSSGYFQCIRHIDQNVLYAVGDSGAIIKTEDGGDSWAYDTSPVIKRLNKMIMLGDKTIAIGDSGTILLNVNIPTTLEVSESLEGAPHLKIFPNPFNDFATIQFDNKINEKYTLTLFDLNGKAIGQIDNITNSQIKLERDNFPSGTYLFQLRNNLGIIGYGKCLIE